MFVMPFLCVTHGATLILYYTKCFVRAKSFMFFYTKHGALHIFQIESPINQCCKFLHHSIFMPIFKTFIPVLVIQVLNKLFVMIFIKPVLFLIQTFYLIYFLSSHCFLSIVWLEMVSQIVLIVL